jgi:protein CpxP
MKRFALFALLTLCLQSLLNAQTPDPYSPVPSKNQPRQDSATKRAVRQLRMLEKQLRLNEDQVLQLQVILINRDVAMDSVQHNPSGDHRTDNRARRSIQQDADQKINAILTDDQKTLYQQWKAEQREKMAMRRQLNQGGDSTRINN